MRRLFSTFAHGWPGAGLLLMRLVTGFALIVQSVARLRATPPVEPMLLPALAILAAVLLVAGLWTPVIGGLVAIIGFTNAIFHRGDPLADVLIGTMGAALALLGPDYTFHTGVTAPSVPDENGVVTGPLRRRNRSGFAVCSKSSGSRRVV